MPREGRGQCRGAPPTSPPPPAVRWPRLPPLRRGLDSSPARPSARVPASPRPPSRAGGTVGSPRTGSGGGAEAEGGDGGPGRRAPHSLRPDAGPGRAQAERSGRAQPTRGPRPAGGVQALGSFSNQSLWRKTPVHGGPPGSLAQLTPGPAGRTPLRTAITWPCYPVPWTAVLSEGPCARP